MYCVPRLVRQRCRQFWGWWEQSGEIGHLGGGVKGAYRRIESANPASVPVQGMGQRLVAFGALLVEAVFEQMSLPIFGIEACCQKCTPRKMAIWPYERGHSSSACSLLESAA